MGEYYWPFEGDTRGLDCSSCEVGELLSCSWDVTYGPSQPPRWRTFMFRNMPNHKRREVLVHLVDSIFFSIIPI